jgi:hypothetical protein
LGVGAEASELVRSGAIDFSDPPKGGEGLGTAQRRQGD